MLTKRDASLEWREVQAEIIREVIKTWKVSRAHTHTVSDDCKSAVRVVFLQPMSSILVKLLRTLEFQVLGVLEGQTLMGKKRRPRKPKDFEGGVQEVGLRKDCVKERK